MSLSDREYQEFIDALDRSIAQFGMRPAEPGIDLDLYNDLRRIRETMIRLRRDLQDPNVIQPPGSNP
jgi:hypothetical protein